MARQDYQPPPQYPDLERMVQQRRLGYLDEQALLRTLNQQRMLSGQQPARSIEEAIGAPPRAVTQTEVAPVQLDPKAVAGRGVSTQATTAPQDSGIGSAFAGLGENLFRPQPPPPPGVPLPRPRPPDAPGPGAPSMTTPTNPYLAAKRAGFAQELQDPATRKYLGALLHAENIGAGAAVVESLFNRAELINESRARQGQRPLSLMQMMQQGGFYGPVNRGEMPAHLAKMNNPANSDRANRLIDQALAGSNTIASHTDQGSARDPNYVRGGIGININGERFNDYGIKGAQEWRMRREAEINAAGGAAAQPQPSGAVPYTQGQVPRVGGQPAALFGDRGDRESYFNDLFGRVVPMVNAERFSAAIGGREPSQNIEDRRDQQMGWGSYLANKVPAFVNEYVRKGSTYSGADPTYKPSPLGRDAGYYDVGLAPRPQPFGQGDLSPIPWTQMQPWGWGTKPPDEPPGGGPSISGEGFNNFKFGGD